MDCRSCRTAFTLTLYENKAATFDWRLSVDLCAATGALTFQPTQKVLGFISNVMHILREKNTRTFTYHVETGTCTLFSFPR